MNGKVSGIHIIIVKAGNMKKTIIKDFAKKTLFGADPKKTMFGEEIEIIEQPPRGNAGIKKTIIDGGIKKATILTEGGETFDMAIPGKKEIEKVNYQGPKISIRQAKTAKPGLYDIIDYLKANGFKPKKMVMVEIGCYVGDSTEIWAKNFDTVHCIDPWINGYDDSDPSSYNFDMEIIEKQFDEMAAKYKNIVKHKMTSIAGSKLFDDHSLDFIYIDGNHLHDYVIADIKAWLPKLKKPGYIAGHDYNHKWAPEVKPAVDSLFRRIDRYFQDTSWIKHVSKDITWKS